MAGFLGNSVLDALLAKISGSAENLYICSTGVPTTFAQASSTYKLGTKATPAFGAIADGDVSGRKLPVTAISDGTVSATGTAVAWAITDDSASDLLAAGSLSANQAVTDGNTFTLAGFDIEVPAPA